MPRPNDSYSRKLTALLRHNVHSSGLGAHLRPDGYLSLDAVLAHHQFSGLTAAVVREIVAASDKQRLALLEENGRLYIRANQGHTIAGLSDLSLLGAPLSVEAAAELGGGSGLAVHGTYHLAWPRILASGGLSKMSRHHVHLAVGLPGESGVISGMRSSCEIAIWVDLARASRAGFEFFQSANGVLLTPGDAGGILPVTFFDSVFDRASGKEIISREELRRDQASREVETTQTEAAASGAVEGILRGEAKPEKSESKPEDIAAVLAGMKRAQTKAERRALQQQQRAAKDAAKAAQAAQAAILLQAAGTAPVMGSVPEAGEVLAAGEATGVAAGKETPIAVCEEITAASAAGWSHYLVLDFEATCERDDPTQSQWSEIIEFPCVLLDAASLEVVAEFRQLVRPTVRPKLTAFCTKLTSITQAQVDAAEPLEEVLSRFGAWLPTVLGSDAAIASVLPVTCGEPDCSVMLPRDCARKGLPVPAVLRRYCNVKRPFAELLASKAGGMKSMLRHLGIPQDGHHHLGIDDARNIAKIVRHLARNGAALDVTGTVCKKYGGN